MNRTVNKDILTVLSNLPKKIINHKHTTYVTDFVLYEICRNECLNFSECAYFIYNPDFHLCKGVAGIKMDEFNAMEKNLWENTLGCSEAIKNSNYNKNIKSIEFCTINTENNTKKVIEEIKKVIQFSYENTFEWNLPNNNIGILLFLSEKHTKENLLNEEFSLNESHSYEDIENAANLLAFCPIY